MSRYLLQLSLGPIQDFIQQARRTRDMWFGSHVLSELSRGAARALVAQKFELVFPAFLVGAPELEFCGQMKRPNGQHPVAVSNIILAASPAGWTEVQVEQAAAAARTEVTATWWRFVKQARGEAGVLLRAGTDPDEAIDGLLEFYAAWAELPDGSNQKMLDDARRGVAGAIAARKGLRNFGPWQGQPGLPKSSLDGFRETALIDRDSGAKPIPSSEQLDQAQRFRIPHSEHLDAIGFVKRCAGRPEQFIPLARVAFEPWISARRAARPTRWADLVGALQTIIKKHTELATCSSDAIGWLGDFPYDGEVFLEDQWPNHPREEGDRKQHAREYEAFVDQHARPLLRGCTPDPYLACIHADGDRMGDALSGCEDMEALVTASKGIAEFASGVRKVVEGLGGSLVYAGGDDVLAFVPAVHAVPCATALAGLFTKSMASAFPDLAEKKELPTLSVGVGITHVLDPMGEHLDRARRAEKLAKTGRSGSLTGASSRNALGVISSRRGGAENVARWSWGAAPQAVQTKIDQAIGGFAHSDFPHGLPYEVRALLRRFPATPRRLDPCDEPTTYEDEPAGWRSILTGELHRMLVQKRVGGLSGTSSAGEIRNVWADFELFLDDTEDYRQTMQRVAEWLDTALVIRHLALARRAVEQAAKSRTSGATTPDEDGGEA